MADREPSLAAQLHVERQIDPARYPIVIGVDEVGRGSWAGPLCIGVTVFDLRHLIAHMSELYADRKENQVGSISTGSFLMVNDSKQLDPSSRERLFTPIVNLALAHGIGYVDASEVDLLGMTKGLSVGLGRALLFLHEYLDSALVLLDGNVDFHGLRDTVTIVKGDTKSFAIASASILAKVARDDLMRQQASHFPWYQFERNKGYPSPAHVSALHAIGPSQIHRKSWAYIDGLPWGVRGGEFFMPDSFGAPAAIPIEGKTEYLV